MEFNIIDNREGEDSITIQLIHKTLIVGYIDINEIYDGFRWFDNEKISEDKYSKLFPDDMFLLIQMVFVNEKFRGKGFGNMLMNEFERIRPKVFPNHNRVVLNASPINFKSYINLSLNLLIMFYEKFGFKELVLEKNNCLMFKTTI